MLMLAGVQKCGLCIADSMFISRCEGRPSLPNGAAVARHSRRSRRPLLEAAACAPTAPLPAAAAHATERVPGPTEHMKPPDTLL